MTRLYLPRSLKRLFFALLERGQFQVAKVGSIHRANRHSSPASRNKNGSTSLWSHQALNSELNSGSFDTAPSPERSKRLMLIELRPRRYGSLRSMCEARLADCGCAPALVNHIRENTLSFWLYKLSCSNIGANPIYSSISSWSLRQSGRSCFLIPLDRRTSALRYPYRTKLRLPRCE